MKIALKKPNHTGVCGLEEATDGRLRVLVAGLGVAGKQVLCRRPQHHQMFRQKPAESLALVYSEIMRGRTIHSEGVPAVPK